MSTRGKVIDLATGSLKKATEEMISVKTSMVQEIREVKNKLSEGKSGEGKKRDTRFALKHSKRLRTICLFEQLLG